MKFRTASTLILIILSLLLLSCSSPKAQPVAPAGSTLTPDEEETATLLSLEQVDDHPLYIMRYFGTYPGRTHSSLPKPADPSKPTIVSIQTSCNATWACSLFAALGDEENRLLGRNFDWNPSPALLLFTDPADGYASISMVDIEYLGFKGERSQNLTDLPLKERRTLLDAPSLPFDGMNKKGLAVGMAAIPREEMPYDPQKKTVDQLEIIREVLDHAATVDEAIGIMGNYNIDMGSIPIHYLIASASGESVVVEFYQGEMVVFRNEAQWQVATNFLIASTNGNFKGQYWRYDLIHHRLDELKGKISASNAMRLLEDVSQDHTQWSIVYQMTTGDIDVVTGRDYTTKPYIFHVGQSV